MGFVLKMLKPRDEREFSGIEASREGRLGGSVVEHLPLAQGLILEIRDRVHHGAPVKEPDSPSACVSASFSLCVSRE